MVEELTKSGIFDVVFEKHDYPTWSTKMQEFLVKRYYVDMKPYILLNNPGVVRIRRLHNGRGGGDLSGDGTMEWK